MDCLKVANRGSQADGVTRRPKRRPQIRLEPAPGGLALPDLHDPEPLVGRAGDVEDEPGRRSFDRARDPFVSLPARSHVLDHHVRHPREAAPYWYSFGIGPARIA